jgi:uncharacterized protein YbjT (DUF2867 family)
VRVVTRDPLKAEVLAKAGAEVVQGDFSDLASLHAASAGMDGVFLLVPFLDPNPGYAANAIAAAVEAGVKLMVWNTTGAIPSERTGNPGLDVRLLILERLKASGLPFIALAPTGYMDNFLGPWTAPGVALADTFAYPFPPSASVQPISHAEAAAYAVEAFRRPEVANAVLDICGPEALTGDDIAVRFSAALGRHIRFRSMPPSEFGAVLDGLYGPGAGAGATAFYDAAFKNPALITTKLDPEQARSLLPIRSTTVEEWVRSNAARFNT